MEIKIRSVDGVKEYSRKTDGAGVFVDEDKERKCNFKVAEFACKDGSDYIKIDSALVIMLQDIRDYFKKPVVINSAYRNAPYNKKIGGASRSQHISGKAADICINGVAPIDIARFVESNCKLIKGIGLYTWGVHVDTRSTPAKWDYTTGKEIAVATFLEGVTNNSPEAPKTNGDYYVVKSGDTVWRICEKNKISLKDFRGLNPSIKNIALIYPGQKVRIK